MVRAVVYIVVAKALLAVLVSLGLTIGVESSTPLPSGFQ